ncbi:sugar phosphate/phosphate translocator-like protein [Emericellopsis cladophorae]|uniref:Sugar phosphate/phosphate translocator-like protein n=1 Tax=Emericellopsis cladophorae TaxID=2686198 RepID=A0A9P9Y3H4_9HYPO|nr:sugar phosphate/phosphate translocator-like protein [Emericellopsis cladophorae]KAI6782415.1 sugar phosphate/phosphate translocator-like protein [Emericellopsis cladophorae]
MAATSTLSPRTSTSTSIDGDNVPMMENPTQRHNGSGHFQDGDEDPEAGFAHKQAHGPESRTLSLHPSFYILSWIFFSNCTILFNKWLIDNAGFRYPILLTCWHLVFATAATQLLARTTSLLESRHTLPIDRRFFLRTILPIGILYSGSLVCSNVVYLYLSVPFIQMLKSASPVVVLFFSWLWGIANPTMSTLLNILVIVLGVAIASAGEIQFSWLGFLYQVGGTVFEAMRLVLIQVMLSSEGLQMDPLVGLYYYAPVCAVMNMFVALWSEVPKFEMQHLWDAGIFMLLLNALVAFMLNIASVCLIGKTSGLVMTLTGILKSILLVIISVIIWQTTISPLQFFGYSVALCGLVYYSLGYETLSKGYHMASSWAGDAWKSGREGQWTPERRRCILITGILAFISLCIMVGIWQGPTAMRKAQESFPSIFNPER